MKNQAADKALRLKQAFGWTGTKCDELDNTTLPESVAIDCALVCVEEILSIQSDDFWAAVKECLIEDKRKFENKTV